MRDKLLKTFALMAIAAPLALVGCNSGDEHAGESASEQPEESAGANAAEHPEAETGGDEHPQ